MRLAKIIFIKGLVMIDYDKQFNDIIAQIQAQYRGSNVAELIKGIIEIKKKGVLRAYKSLINDCLNLSKMSVGLSKLFNFLNKNCDLV